MHVLTKSPEFQTDRQGLKTRSLVAVWIFAAVLIALIWVGISYKIDNEHQVELALIDRNNLNLARAFEEHTIRTLQGVDQSVLFLKYQYEKIGDQIAIGRYVNEGMIQDNLFNQLGIINEKGLYTHSNLGSGIGINLSDREHFRVHIPSDTGKLFVSKPVLGRATNKWSLQLSRRINNRDGSFGGAVVVSLNPEYLTKFYRQIDIGSLGIVALVGADGIVRARRMGDELSYGQDISQNAVIKKAMQEEQGTATNFSTIDGRRRIYGYQKVTGYPLWVFVAVEEDEALLQARSRAHSYKAYGALMTLLMLGFAAAVTLTLRRQHAVAQELLLSNEAAKAANMAKSRFLATMSHEIRTPMNGVLGMAQLLMTPNLSESHRSDYARTILSSGQTLLTLLNDILDLSRIEAGKFQLDNRVFDPESLLHETSMLFSGAAQAKGLQLHYQWLGKPAQRFNSDAGRLRQMMSNLVGNAIKFTSDGQVRLEARELERDADHAVLVFTVSDSGVGIAPDKLDLLFKPFSQADSSITREYGGSGLGLSIVRNLALAMGGDVGVSSEPGRGSKFWFQVRVNIVSQDQDSRHAPRVASTQVGSQPGVLRGHVAVAEDNAINATVIQLMLDRLGVTTSLFKDGQQVVEALCQPTSGNPPNLVLMDLHMPVLNGDAATERIRQWEADNMSPRLPIIALTADAFEEDRRHCLAVGMDDFLTKPISIEALAAALVKWLPAVPTIPIQKQAPIAFKPLDGPAFEALLNELTPLLQHHKFAAIDRFKEFQVLVAGTALADEMDSLSTLLRDMRFDMVLRRLREMAAQSIKRGLA